MLGLSSKYSYSDTKSCVPFSVCDVLFSKSRDSLVSSCVIWIRDKALNRYVLLDCPFLLCIQFRSRTLGV